jgi:hypothetical protein
MKMKIICSVVPVEMLESLHEHLMHFHLCKDYGLCVGELTDESFYSYYDRDKFKALLMEEDAWKWPTTIEQIKMARADFEDGWNKSIEFMKSKQMAKNIQFMKDYAEAYKENKNYR